MSPVWFIVMLVLIFLVVAVLTSPWRRRDSGGSLPTDARVRELAVEVEDLEAARDAKYREIRDAELDHQTRKLSDADFKTVDGGLRAEAIEILRRLDRAQKRLDKLRAAEAEQEVITGLDLDRDVDVADEDEGGDEPALGLDAQDEPELGPGAERQPDAARAHPDRD